MRTLAQVCFYAGLLSIPLAIGFWFVGPSFAAAPWDGISDPALRAALTAANKERWGIFIGLWPATLLILSTILEARFGGGSRRATLDPAERGTEPVAAH
jgi:hypothetical protein